MNINTVLRVPFYEAVCAFHGRHLVDAEWQDFCAVLLKWADVVRDLTASTPTRSLHPTAGWARRRNQHRRPPPPSLIEPTPEPIPSPPSSTARISDARSHHRAPGRQRDVAKARKLQRLYRSSPSVCVRKILDDSPPSFCSIPEADLVSHFTASYAAAEPLAPPPPWLISRPLSPGLTAGFSLRSRVLLV